MNDSREKVDEFVEPFFDNQWNLKIMQVDLAHKLSAGEGAVVGIIDSGIDGSHRDFGWEEYIDLSASDSVAVRKRKYEPVLNAIRSGNHPTVLSGWNFVEGSDDTFDTYRHGTYLAGTIGARRNEFGMLGIAPECKIRPYVVVEENGYVSPSNVAKALYRAYDDGCHVVNLSLAFPYDDSELLSAVNELSSDEKFIMVAATGNNNIDRIYYPAKYAGVLAIGGCDAVGNRWVHNSLRGSNYGNEILCVCPAANQVTTFFMRWRYANIDGTSQACANFVGVVALLKSLDRGITRGDIIELVRANRKWDVYTGYGVPSAYMMCSKVSKVDVLHELDMLIDRLVKLKDYIREEMM